ncbi:MAG TPA: SRPBCC family protein [Chloroflexota bacterium]|jgi:carbon monoxide dehydrogenase subunit G|nr:SRPBCC family protein [Chloroflexota bacterium]
MKFEHSVAVQAPKQKLWDLLMDVPRVAKCVPGVESVEALGDDKYRGTLKVSVGPIKLALQGDISITDSNQDAGKAAMRADAADKRVGGAVKATMDMQVDEASADTSNLTIVTDAQVMGRIGEFGQPIIRKKADQIMQEFARNLSKEVSA